MLGILYESFIHPITILSTLPSAGIGALLAVQFAKSDLNIIALIGIILLIGIVKKNAILMIDFAVQAERLEGKSTLDAIYQACLLRFRPIMMTTMAALLGGLPLALSSGTGSETVQTPYNLHLNRGNSSFDLRHNIVLSWTYELPFGKGKTFLRNAGGPLQWIAGGWQLNGIDTFQTQYGRPPRSTAHVTSVSSMGSTACP